jgi:hypothetical protein
MSKYLTRESKGIRVIPVEGDESHCGYYKHESDSSKSGEAWKLNVGAERNLLLEMAEDYDESPEPEDAQKAEAIRSIVARVAEFESLEVEV